MASARSGRPDSDPSELSCEHCGSNRLRFPATGDAPVTCEDCGKAGPLLHELQDRFASGLPGERGRRRSASAHAEGRTELRERHEAEVDASQAGLRESIAETDRLVDESDDMLRRHRIECDERESGG